MAAVKSLGAVVARFACMLGRVNGISIQDLVSHRPAVHTLDRSSIPTVSSAQ